VSGVGWGYLSHGWLVGHRTWPRVLPPWCGIYDHADYTTFILLKMRFYAGHRRVQVICVCVVYAQKYSSCLNSIVSVSYGPYITSWYLVKSRSGQRADSTVWPLSGSGWIVKIPIRYIPTKNCSNQSQQTVRKNRLQLQIKYCHEKKKHDIAVYHEENTFRLAVCLTTICFNSCFPGESGLASSPWLH